VFPGLGLYLPDSGRRRRRGREPTTPAPAASLPPWRVG